ncbi:MAG: pyridoxamine 5'-phosphate oxidase [Flavobacteriaceae bacterium]
MQKDLGNYRKSYNKGTLLESDISESPFKLFENWFFDVDKHFPDLETNAMMLSTIGLDGFPKGRVVLLKKFSNDGFTFFTNYNSDKSKSILSNPKVCLSFHWEGAERQVIIKGYAKKISDYDSDTYFNSRPRGSKLGAHVSMQSSIIKNREVLEDSLDVLSKRFDKKEIKRPDFWGGFIVRPIEIEFWQGRANRLHDRIRYKIKDDMTWSIDRLSP